MSLPDTTLNGAANGHTEAKPSRRPSLQDLFYDAVERGDFAEVLDRLLHAPPPFMHRGEGVAGLARAVDIASRTSAPAFSQTIFQQVISFCAQVQMRMQCQAASALGRAEDPGQMPQEF